MKTIGNKKALVPFVVTHAEKQIVRGKWAISKIDIASFTNDTHSNPSTIDWNENAMKTILDKVPGIPVSELKYIDLTFPDKYCHGVYLFSKDDEFTYIGKCRHVQLLTVWVDTLLPARMIGLTSYSSISE